MHSFSVWRDQILLHWDFDAPPPGCHYSIEAIKAEPEVVLPYWPKIENYSKWSKKLSCYMMSFSKQNLIRIYEQFGKIQVKAGQRAVDLLKLESGSLISCTAKAMRIKNGGLEEIPYKAPPLGLFQHIGVNLLVHCERVPLFAEPGVGKTYMVLTSTQEQFRRGLINPGKVLVCAKLLTIEAGWMRDCEKFTHMKASMVWAKPGKNRKEKLLEKLNEPADIYIINHDGVRVLEEELAAKRFEKVVVDESTILKGYKGDRSGGGAFAKALFAVSEHAKWRVIMSGTPSPNGPEDLWGQMLFLDPYGTLLERTVHDFRRTFMDQIFYGDPKNKNTPSSWTPRHGAVDEVSRLISALAYRIRIRDCIDLPEKTVIRRSCPMSDEQFGHYVEMLRKLMTEIDGEEVSVDVILAKIAKLRQITGGFLIDRDEVPHPIEDNPKLEMMDSLLLDEIPPEHKVVIYAQFRWEIEMLALRYKNLGIKTVYGGNPSQRNLDNIKEFINDPKIRVIIMHPASAAHGITLVVSCYMIMYSNSYSSEADSQCQARIERAGQKQPMFIYYLLSQSPDPEEVEETIDEIMLSVIEEKKFMQQRIIDADVVDRFRRSFKGSGKKCSQRKTK